MKDQTTADQLESVLGRIALADQAALEVLYTLVAPKLNGIAMKIVNDPDLANDILQETFLQIWHKAGEYRRHLSEPMTWMTSLLRYRALDKLKAETREKKRRDQQEEVQSLFDENVVATPLSTMLQANSDSQLNTCLKSLETLNRNAILMAYYYGYNREDIAIHLEKPVNTIKSWLKRGLTRLAECLSH